MALEGSLHDMSLEDLFQIFRTGSKSGVLMLANDPERGIVYVFQGRLVDAVTLRKTDRQIVAASDDAVLQMLLWDNATFVFRNDLCTGKRPVRIRQDSACLVLEAMRRRDNTRRAQPFQPIALDARIDLTATPNAVEAGINLDLDQWRFLSQVTTSSNIREICERVAMDSAAALKIAAELAAIGLVEVVPAPAQPHRLETMARPIQPAPALGAVGALSYREELRGPSRGLLGAIRRRVRAL